MLKPGETFQKHRFRGAMVHLIDANLLLIALDIILLSLEYTAIWGIWCSFKFVIYSTKLRMVFNLFNQLKSLATGHSLSQTYLNMFTDNICFLAKNFIIPNTKLFPEVTPGSQLQGSTTHFPSAQSRPRGSPKIRLWMMVSSSGQRRSISRLTSLTAVNMMEISKADI
jgi:hypothetical protein